MRNEPDAAASVGKWILATTIERRRMKALLRAQPTTRLTRDDIRALVDAREITVALEAAGPSDKAAVQPELRITVTYHRGPPVQRTGRPPV